MANRLGSPEAYASPSDHDRSCIRRGVKALISTSTRTLLVKERHTDGTPFWTLPGGGVRPHETLSDGLRRELIEELRSRPVINEVVTTFVYSHSSLQDTVSMYTVFDCALLSEATPVRDEGVLEHRWVRPTDLPASTLPQVRHLIRTDGIT